MKRSLRLLATLLLLLPVGTTLSFRAALRRRSPPSSSLNSTLLSLAALDPAESEIHKDVAGLLSATATPTTTNPPNPANFSVITLWRPSTFPGRSSRSRIPIRIRAPKNLQILPSFRLLLTNWLHNRRILHPSIMSELLLLIKRPIDLQFGYPDTLRRYASCAVVGNSGILLKSEHGEFIDGHDIVIRLNNARVAGYERHVGHRTSVSFINSNILHLCARREGCGCHPYGHFIPIVMYVCQPAHFLDYLACNSSHGAPLLITDPRLDALCGGVAKYYSMKRFVEETGRRPEEWGKARDERTFHYSSGMQAVVLALGICERVSVLGFGKPVGAKHHYHTNQKAELDLHDYEAEYAFYHDLVERPQVIPFLKDSRFKIPPVVFYG